MQVSAVESPTAASIEPSERRAVACCFTLGGDLRFLAHHDELRMLARAVRRAGWPLAYSRGFNPQPRIVLPLPRRVGTTSECQWVVVQLDEDRPLEQLHGSLAAALPGACRLRRVVALPARTKLHPCRVAFELELEREHAAGVAARITKLMAEETLLVERAYGPDKPAGVIDIRPYIETIILDGRKLTMRLAFVQRRTARPSEVLTVLHLPATAYDHRVRQVEVEWNMALGGLEQWPPGAERNNVGREEDRCAQTKGSA
jgi:radical SAM-linked protein